MDLLRYIERAKYMDRLIRRRGTGTPEEFAKKIGVSRSSLFQYVKLLKAMNAPIEYDHHRESYYYLFPCRLMIGFESSALDEAGLTEVNKKSMQRFCDLFQSGNNDF